MKKVYEDLIIINLYSRNWSQKWEVCKNQTNYWTLKTIVLDLAWLKKNVLKKQLRSWEVFIQITFSIDWIFFRNVWRSQLERLQFLISFFFDRKLIKSVPIATVVIQWKFDSKSSFFLPDFFDAVNCKDIELLIFWLRACRSGVFSGFFQQCQAMLDLLKIFI